MAGIQYIPEEKARQISLGGVGLTADSLGRILVNNTKAMDDFGKKMGYQDKDELVSLNGETLTLSNTGALIQKFYSTAKEGDMVKVVVRRKMPGGQSETLTLSAPALKVEKPILHQLKFDEKATPEQLQLRKVWLNTIEK